MNPPQKILRIIGSEDSNAIELINSVLSPQYADLFYVEKRMERESMVHRIVIQDTTIVYDIEDEFISLARRGEKQLTDIAVVMCQNLLSRSLASILGSLVLRCSFYGPIYIVLKEKDPDMESNCNFLVKIVEQDFNCRIDCKLLALDIRDKDELMEFWDELFGRLKQSPNTVLQPST